MKLEKIISGGQTGVDQAGLRAAKISGFKTGGMVPRKCLTEDGPNLDLISIYGCHESKSDTYPPRTFDNVKNSDATMRIAYNFNSPGEKLTLTAISNYARPYIDVQLDLIDSTTSTTVARWLYDNNVVTLNIAGNREKTNKGIGHEAEIFLLSVFEQYKKLI